MREQLEARLAGLQREFSAGEQKLREIEGQQARLRDALLRIVGAMHLLHEMLANMASTEVTSDVSRGDVLPTPGNGGGASMPVEYAGLSQPR